MKHLLKTTALALILGSQLSACVGLLAAGAISGAGVAADRREVHTNAVDKKIEFQLARALSGNFPAAHINTEVFNRSILLTGEVPTVEMGRQAEALAQAVPDVRRVHNELVVGDNSSYLARTGDTAITAKVKAAFLKDNMTQSGAIITTTERGNVYLQGQVTQAEGARAAEIARNVGNVRQVVKLFDYLTDEQFRQLNNGLR